jgi:hypothetical protein
MLAPTKPKAQAARKSTASPLIGSTSQWDWKNAPVVAVLRHRPSKTLEVGSLLNLSTKTLVLALGQILSDVAEFLRPFDQRPLATLLLFGGDRLVDDSIGGSCRQLRCFFGFLFAGRVGSKSTVDEASNRFGASWLVRGILTPCVQTSHLLRQKPNHYGDRADFWAPTTSFFSDIGY